MPFSLATSTAGTTYPAAVRSLLCNIKSDELPDATINLGIYLEKADLWINERVLDFDTIVDATRIQRVTWAAQKALASFLAMGHCKGSLTQASSRKQTMSKGAINWDEVAKDLLGDAMEELKSASSSSVGDPDPCYVAILRGPLRTTLGELPATVVLP